MEGALSKARETATFVLLSMPYVYEMSIENTIDI
jgi:hypothetical protein